MSQEHRWKINDRVVVICGSNYFDHIGTVTKIDNGHALVAFDSPPKGWGSPAWFLRHEIREAAGA